MNINTPVDITRNYALAGKAKAEKPFHKLLWMSVFAGLFIAFGAAVTSTATHSLADVSTARIVNGLLFPFGLCMVILLGAELFTGNILICISVLNRDTSIFKMLRNWSVVYLGNFVGSVLLAAAGAWFGQLDYSSGGLALYTMKIAEAKSGMLFGNALVMGVLCNILVCCGVLCSLSAKDTTGRILGAYIPVAFFVICGFEHSVANMYYVPAGIFAAQIPRYAELAMEAGINISGLTWGSFILNNLLPVTIGNILGGISVGFVMWVCNLRLQK